MYPKCYIVFVLSTAYSYIRDNLCYVSIHFVWRHEYVTVYCHLTKQVYIDTHHAQCMMISSPSNPVRHISLPKDDKPFWNWTLVKGFSSSIFLQKYQVLNLIKQIDRDSPYSVYYDDFFNKCDPYYRMHVTRSTCLKL